MKLVPALIIAMGLFLAALIVVFVPLLIPGTTVPGMGGQAVDSTARFELEDLRTEVEALRDALTAVDERMAGIDQSIADLEAPPPEPLAPGETARAPRLGPNLVIDAYDQVVLVADRRNLNAGLTVPTPRFLVETLGMPRGDLSQDCQGITNPRLADLVKTETVGPIEVRMLQPAIDSLRTILATIQSVDPDLYARINTSGSLCVRFIRGSTTSVSTHSFGLAVDLNIDGVLDTLGDGQTQLGLTILADFFNAEGWVWGAAYGREDSMHFEVAKETVERWVAEGKL